ncbi:MAG: hypothetical protein ABW123_17980 [Cystobacter sp.]
MPIQGPSAVAPAQVRLPSAVPPAPPPAAVNTTSAIPTDSDVKPLTVADYSLKKKPEGVTGKSGERQVTAKQVGEPGKPGQSGLVVGQAKVTGESFFDHGKDRLQAQAKGEAALTGAAGKYEHTHEGRLGSTRVKAEFEVGARVKGEVGGLLSKKDMSAVAHAQANGLAGATGSFLVEQKHGKHFGESVQGSVRAGAIASATATFAFEPKQGTVMAKVGYSALVGAQESLSGEIKMGVFRFSGGVAAQQGVGSRANFGAGVMDGRFMLNADVGAALGLGASVKVGMSVNGRAIAEKSHAVGHAVKEGAHTVGHAVKQGARTTGHAVKEGAHTVGHKVKEKVRDGVHVFHHHRPKAESPPAFVASSRQNVTS